MNIAVHHARHEFHRVIGLEPAGLIADHRIGGGVGFVKAVVGEFFQKVEHLAGFLGVDVVGDLAAFDEFGPFLGHFLGDFLPHRAAQQVSPAKRVAAHDLRDLHHLFLVDDDALGFREDMVNRRVDGFQRFQPVLDLAIGRDVFHRAGAIQRHERHDIFDAGGFHAPERIHHARAFHLKHRDGFGGGIKVIGRLVVQGDMADVIFGARRRVIQPPPIGGLMQGAAGGADLLDGVLNDGQGFQAEKVELHQPRRFDPFHVELGGGHVRAGVLVEGDQFVQRPVADHDARGMGGGVAVKSFDFLGIGQEAAYHLFLGGLT